MPSRTLKLWAAGVFAAGLAVVLTTFRDYGITWDEPVQSHYGEGVLRYFASGLSDRSVDGFLHMRFYGPLFELAAALAYAPAPDAKYEIRHLLTAGTGLLTVLGVLGFGARMPGRFVAVLAPLALVTLPRFYGHAFNNSKDVPFACAFTFATWASWRLATSERSRDGWRSAIVCGLALGATLAIRPGGLPLLALLFGCAIAWRLALRGPVDAAGVRETATVSAAAWALAWGGMVLLWPWAHENPLLNPLRAVAAALSFPDTFPVLFEGTVTRSDALPRYYLAKYLAITTPPLLLTLAIAGIGVSVREAIRRPRAPETAAALLCAAWLLAPLALATVGRPNVYDGMRHLLFALPALALLAGIGASAGVEGLVAWLSRRAPERRRLAPALTAALCIAVASSWVDLARLHPYQSSYFNGFVGGLAGAGGRYEADYWLSSYKEAMEWVNARAAESGRPVSVLVAADPYSAECAGRFVGPGVEMVRTVDSGVPGEIPEAFDYYLATTRYGLDRNFPGSRVVHRVAREGTALTVIRGRIPDKRGLSQEAAPSALASAGGADPEPR